MANARAIATRCCWPPDNWPGKTSLLCRQPDPLEQRPAHRRRLGRGHATHPDGRLDDVFERRHVREEVEALEDHSDLLALAGDVLLAILDEPAIDLLVADQVAVHANPPAVDLLEVVDASQERRLAGARRTDHADHFTATDRQRGASEHVQAPESLLHIDCLHDDLGGCDGRAPDGIEQIAGGWGRRPNHDTRAGDRTLNSRAISPGPESTASPLPNRRSIQPCTIPQRVVSSRYQTAAAR